MKRLIGIVTVAVAMLAFSGPAFADATLIPGAIWANGQLYGTVLTPTSLPDKGPFTPIANFSNSGLSGQRSISAAGPGDRGFYGGRWQVYLASYTPSGLAHFGNGSGGVNQELESWSELQSAIDSGYVTLTLTSTRFVCTLVPGK